MVSEASVAPSCFNEYLNFWLVLVRIANICGNNVKSKTKIQSFTKCTMSTSFLVPEMYNTNRNSLFGVYILYIGICYYPLLILVTKETLETNSYGSCHASNAG